ncbi:hypothetical protein BJ508DRAFT_75493 [Ascobolus immersus RN42]|uniref:Uncharacterized protein n=1 Tax=Ascobolus immersus RN42 TaxID=1160509 RepID=A0A3N4HDP0_ASCIM|nr:hypothetical protein BJ508DRAFT_75493 [Ascobolus immersus RN42]
MEKPGRSHQGWSLLRRFLLGLLRSPHAWLFLPVIGRTLTLSYAGFSQDSRDLEKPCATQRIPANSDIAGIGIIIAFTLCAVSAYIASILRWAVQKRYEWVTTTAASCGTPAPAQSLLSYERMGRNLDTFLLSMCDLNSVSIFVLIIATAISLKEFALYHVLVATELIQFTVSITSSAAGTAHNQALLTRSTVGGNGVAEDCNSTVKIDPNNPNVL